ncbi:MAG: DNA-binding protein [Alphaproteobacteria bacterium]|nr:MAG: DNA-binding protein [Alphaproteobacteria bacterium]
MEENLQAFNPPDSGPALMWHDQLGLLHPKRGLVFAVASHSWIAGTGTGTVIDAVSAVRRLVGERGARRLPVGVIGPSDASPAELAQAQAAGRAVAALGLPMICGGRGGCMAAAARGAADAGGLVIGVLRSTEWLSANAHIHVPIATGLGEARNAVIASASLALIAVGSGHGTLSEMALGLKLGRLVIAMPEAERMTGAISCPSADAAMELVAHRYLGLDAEESA